MVCTLCVVGHLLRDGHAEIEAERTSQIEDADRGVGQLHFDTVAMRQVRVHQPLAICFARFADFAMDQQELLRNQGVVDVLLA